MLATNFIKTLKMIMKLVALIAFLAAVYAQNHHVCFPGEYTTGQLSHDPQQDDTLITKHTFSERVPPARIDLHLEDPAGPIPRQRGSYVFDWPAKKWYEIHYTGTGPNELNCTVHALDGNFERPCLSRRAHLRGQFVLGGTMLCDNFVEFRSDNSFRAMLDIAIAANINIPIRAIERRDRDNKTEIHSQEWVDFFETVHHDAFHVPSACMKESALLKTSDAQKISQIVPTIYGDFTAAGSLFQWKK